MKKTIMAIVSAVSLTGSLEAQQKSGGKENTVQLIRSATLKLNYAGRTFVVDPMFSAKGEFMSFAGVEKNPTVGLPMPVEEIKKNVEFVLVTHTHIDHFDPAASAALDKSSQLYIQPTDVAFFEKEKFTKAKPVNDSIVDGNITIHRTSGQHGKGAVGARMGNVSGFVLKSPGHPTIYIVGDCIFTDEILGNIKHYDPDYIIVNSGGAFITNFQVDGPIIMDESQVVQTAASSAKAKVIAVHMEALDHCPVTRVSLRNKANFLQIREDKLLIPKDGEVIRL
ncbi:MBL fold metallo-hydrolase [Pseudoflavitalea sp. G-6-1-2]|uniref:MBL fold metallo-hydrolase n=1 Tax=Pseudoflavitalea sp. G-6-1-2 TaxID=2728841 RepID=UPI00146BABFD|nr:MBL fold metallo-hydrolase [Pseudoflavitalea sp. G-6-1-2]NML23829.1 MBL fold metallo-hydrolase [Pseudoflavitalea sp. G-6-1-2]